MKAVQGFSFKVILYVRSSDGQIILYMLHTLEKHSAAMVMCEGKEKQNTCEPHHKKVS